MQSAEATSIRHSITGLLLILVYLAFGYFPFQLDVPHYAMNEAEWSEDGLLKFDGPGMARTNMAPEWLRNISNGDNFHLRIRFRPREIAQFGPARILSVSENFNASNLTIGQVDTDIVVRIRRDGSDLLGLPAIQIENVVSKEKWLLLDIFAGSDEMVVSIDGVERHRLTLGGRRFSDWDDTYRLVLGNEYIGERPWLGDISQVSVSTTTGSLDYIDSRSVHLPSGWWHIDERLRNWYKLDRRVRSNFWDVIVNFLGFLPLGAYLWWRIPGSKSSYVVLLVSGATSMCIEIGQIFLDGRHPSIRDFTLNVLGALFGWMLFRTWQNYRNRGAPE